MNWMAEATVFLDGIMKRNSIEHPGKTRAVDPEGGDKNCIRVL